MSQPRRWRTAATSLVVATLTFASLAAHGDSTGPAPRPVDLGSLSDYRTPPTFSGKVVPTDEWFVEFRSEPTASGGKQAEIRRNREDFTAEARAAKLPADVTRVYTTLFNGVTVRADEAQATALSGLKSVKSVFPVQAMKAPDAPPPPDEAANRTTLEMIGADKAQSDLGVTGQGIQVGIIDSGIDYHHPDFGGDPDASTFPTARVTKGWDFSGDFYSPYPDENGDVMPVEPDADPDDCMGHGTHVAGIVGGAGEVVGVAPEVTFGAYKVFTCDGWTNEAIVMEAMERATADGMDVVNMSLGWPFQSSPNFPLSTAADRMVDAGVVLVVAAGNEGEFGTQTLRAPSVSSKAISVASFDATGIMVPEARFTPSVGEPISAGYVSLSEAPVPKGFTGELATFSDPLQCKADPSLNGKVAFFSGDGGCDLMRRAQLAEESGAIGVVVYKDYFFFDWSDGTIPTIGVLSDTGTRVQAAIQDGPVQLTIPGGFVEDPNPYTPGLASYFTSWGLTADLRLKPDLAAPGGGIYSTLPLELGAHGLMSGTSMAAPHVAGAAALMLQDADRSAAQVMRDLQNTATPAVFSFMPDSGVPDAAHRQGAGLIHVDKAITNQHHVSPSTLSTGQSVDGAFTQTLTFTNASDADVTWAASHEDAVTTSVDWAAGRLQFNPYFTQESAQVTFSADTVTVPAGGSATLTVTIDAPEEAMDTATYSGYLRFTTAGQSIQVPFAGIKGDYSDMPLLLGEMHGNPPQTGTLMGCMVWEDRRCVDDYLDVWSDEEMTFGPDALPVVVFAMGVQASSVKLSVLQVDADGNPVEASEQTVYTEQDPWRPPDQHYAPWDGLWADGEGNLDVAPDGDYALRIAVTNFDSPARTDVWTTPAFTWLENPYPDPEPTDPAPEPTPTKPPKPTPTPEPEEPKDVYNTPGLHEVNGRKWFTACEPYSQTTRCRTMIWATQIAQVNGVFRQTNGWVFNNLTYLPKMTRSEWGANPLAKTGSWTAADGRKWRTECDTALTGRGGCRSFIVASVIEARPKAGGGYTYQWVTKEVFNNMVRFKKG